MKVVPLCRECEDCKRYLAHKKIVNNCYSPEVKDGKGKRIGARGMITSPPWCPKRIAETEPEIEVEKSEEEVVDNS